MTTLTWARERLDNSTRIAAEKTGEDRTGWLEDVAYWAAIVAELTDYDRLRDWRNTVTVALQRDGGAKFADVPDHIRALVGDSKRYAELADAVVGSDRLSVEDRDFWTHEMTVHNARQARADGDENTTLRARIETFTETERLAIENANRAWAEVKRLDAVLSRIESLRLSWCAWQERIQADYWKDQGVVSILEKAIRQLGEVAGPVGALVRSDAPKHGIWGNDDAVLEAAQERAAAKIEAIRKGNSR